MAMNFRRHVTGMGKTGGFDTFIANLAPPRLKGKAERPHGRDERELYQLLTYTDEVDPNEKLTEGENYYNDNRPPWGIFWENPLQGLACLA